LTIADAHARFDEDQRIGDPPPHPALRRIVCGGVVSITDDQRRRIFPGHVEQRWNLLWIELPVRINRGSVREIRLIRLGECSFERARFPAISRMSDDLAPTGGAIPLPLLQNLRSLIRRPV